MEWDDIQARVAVWRKIIEGPHKSWVLFRNGTCVVMVRSEPNLAQQARHILADWGAVGTTNPTADYRVVKVTKAPGWVVACHEPDILVYLAPEEFGEEEPSEDQIGKLGRGRRYADAAEMEVVHVEDRRPGTQRVQ
jgi:hypothetical protein